MKKYLFILLLVFFHVNETYAQFTLENTFDGLTQRVNRRWRTDFSIEDDYREMNWYSCYYPLGYFFTYRLDQEDRSYTISVYDDNYDLYTQKTYIFQIPQDYYIVSCNMH